MDSKQSACRLGKLIKCIQAVQCSSLVRYHHCNHHYDHWYAHKTSFLTSEKEDQVAQIRGMVDLESAEGC